VDGENYNTWYTALQLALNNRGIWPIITGTELRLDQTTDPTGYEEWGLKDREARLMILLALRKVGQNCVFHGTSSKEYWDHITSQYSGAGGSNKHTVSLLQQFFMISFKDSEPMQPQIDCVVHTAQQLKTVSFPIDNCLLAFLLAIHLPDSYVMLHTVITNLEATNITSKWVVD